MTETHELRIAHHELMRLAIPCSHCGAETLVDFRDERQKRVYTEGAALKCGICQAPFDSRVRTALFRLHEWFEELRESGQTVTFVLSLTPGSH